MVYWLRIKFEFLCQANKHTYFILAIHFENSIPKEINRVRSVTFRYSIPFYSGTWLKKWKLAVAIDYYTNGCLWPSLLFLLVFFSFNFVQFYILTLETTKKIQRNLLLSECDAEMKLAKKLSWKQMAKWNRRIHKNLNSSNSFIIIIMIIIISYKSIKSNKNIHQKSIVIYHWNLYENVKDSWST